MVVLVLAVASGSATIARPRLRADSGGLTVRTLRGARSWPWSAVEFRVRRTARLGRTTELLEIDTADDQLVVLGKLDLGADPRDVAEELVELRP